ncbi:MAG: hypothetical protein ACLFN8_00810 [Candidatus Woesearchaeota archaeon]
MSKQNSINNTAQELKNSLSKVNKSGLEDKLDKYRILEVLPKANKGNEVIIRYYDSETFSLFEKEDVWDHITPSIEIDWKKYGFKSPSELLSKIRESVDGSFELKKYGSKNVFSNEYDDSTFYREGSETVLIWHRGNREDRHNLEFFLDEDKKKQIFIRNSKKRFLARTEIIPDFDELASKKDYLFESLKERGVFEDDISVNYKRKFVEVKCVESLLKELDSSLFRINIYEGPEFDSEKTASEYLNKIKEVSNFKNHVDQFGVVHKRRSKFDVKYCVRLTANNNISFMKSLSEDILIGETKYRGLKPLGDLIKSNDDKNVKLRRAREELFDPLNLNSPTSQLRDFFPLHMLFNPKKTLLSQINNKVPALSHFVSEKPVSSLEGAVNCAFNFYLKNSAVIDIEVTGYDKSSRDISGRVFMAVLESEVENKIYMTKDAWLNDDVKSIYLDNLSKRNSLTNSNVELVFADDEVDLIGLLNFDSMKYEYIIGHNFEEFDQKHLIKFNNDSALNRQGIISDSVENKIKQYKQKNNSKNLWTLSSKKILDTKKYVENRIPILKDFKLATFANSSKSLDYNLMEEYVNSGNPDLIWKIIDYTIEDGVKSRVVKDLFLKNAVLESIASNKPLPSVFNNNPVKNFYDMGSRDYFMRLGTYKLRHEFSLRHNLEKLEDRLSPDEIIYSLFKREKQTEGIISGELVFPGVIINAGIDIIKNNHSMKLIHERMLESSNFVEKYDLLAKHHSFLHVAIDKIKNFMDLAGLEFGKRYRVEDVFKSFNVEGDVFEDVYFSDNLGGSSDFELSRTNYIFSAEYKCGRKIVRRGLIPFDYTMLDINNIIADHIRYLGVGLVAKTEGLYVREFTGLNFGLGVVDAVNFKDRGLIGRIDNFNVYLNRKEPKSKNDDLIFRMFNYFLDNLGDHKDMQNKFLDEIYSRPPAFWKANQKYIRALTGIDPYKSKGTLPLF